MLRMFVALTMVGACLLGQPSRLRAQLDQSQPEQAQTEQAQPVQAQPAAQSIDFDSQVRPLLERHCTDCHGRDTAESQLRLDSMLGALRGGDSGETTIVPGASLRSHLIQRVTSTDPGLRMPPPEAAALTPDEVALLSAWIDDAPAWTAAQTELAKPSITHWSFQKVERPAVPDNGQAHPIDAFIQATLAEQGLTLSERSDPRPLIRRLFLVMHGLPPQPQQVAQFVSENLSSHSDQVWSAWIDHVLSSPHYGERWAMHWLDLIRFGETNGFETNRERPNAYHFRDWVIESLNTDKPYDQFIREQLAGDALAAPVATGFLVSGPNDIVKGQDKLLGLMQRQDELTDIVNTTGTAFLGLTTGCARCHNHKFDPITQSDFFAMQAIFAGVEHADNQLPLTPAQNAALANLQATVTQAQERLEKLTGTQRRREPVNSRENVESFAPRMAQFVRFRIERSSASEPCIDELQVFAGADNVALASLGTQASSSGDFVHPLHKLEHINDGQFGNSRSWIASTTESAWLQLKFASPAKIERIVWGRDREGKFSDRLAVEYQIESSLDGQSWETVASSSDRLPAASDQQPRYDLSLVPDDQRADAEATWAQLQQAEAAISKLMATRTAYTGKFTSPPEIHRLFRGDPTAPREVVEPGTISALGQLSPRLSNATSEQQRRLALADWIASPTNPLTARVMVNRLWQFHFGTGLVDTPSDFGANGTLPTHPELLDWLAAEFMDHGWSLKYMHRLILTSRTWQQSSQPRAEAIAIDAASRLLWRFPPRRLEAEPIRDCILAVTGKLDRSLGGPGFSAFEVELENVRHYFPKKDYGPGDWRRMIYMTKVRQEKDSTFGVFDCPDASQVTPKRSRSTTPLQALNLLNSRFVLQQAEFLAERLQASGANEAQRIELAWQLCFGRSAAPAEVAAASQFLTQSDWIQFSRALLNSNEFVFIP